ncbi:Pas18 [Actinoplanes phage phiAsp2]|uniref:Pas18 n=1 Tax=Actinoplanes phage phiAsp2 TaxID=279303 RepID=Q6J813_9CAUD|nr:Pas18 [Actinoplanes phage phiAsp2]AAT36766.1 Pas18 [Actinoplanes phage phiAsp2]
MSEPKKSNVRVCQTCKGQGTITRTKTETVKIDGVKQTVKTTETVSCTARCNNGVINIRNV